MPITTALYIIRWGDQERDEALPRSPWACSPCRAGSDRSGPHTYHLKPVTLLAFL